MPDETENENCESLTPEQKDDSTSCSSPNCEKSGIDDEEEVISYGSDPVEFLSTFLMLPLLVSY